MASTQVNGKTFEYEAFGEAAAPALLLIMGLGAQLTLWPEPFCRMLADRGYYVIRFDNRDVGLSHKCDGMEVPDATAVMMAMGGGEPIKSPYALSDMAADAAGLLDALGLDRAHIVGASMGGMIAQLVAAEHPGKTLSMTSIMSTTGNRDLPPPRDEAMMFLGTPPIDPAVDMEGAVNRGVQLWKAIGSPDVDEEALRVQVRTELERSFYPDGFARQLAAIAADGDRRGRIGGITAPVMVIHGKEDPLVPVEGGRDTAAAIPGAQIVEIAGMGHDVPPKSFGQIVDAIVSVASQAARAA